MRRFVVATLVLAAAVLTACARPAGAPAGWPVGHEFWSTAVTENGRDRPLATGSRISLEIPDAQHIVVRPGCNILTVYARVDGGRISVSQIAQTAMGCLDPALAEQDAWASDFFQASPAWKLTGDTLVLTAGTREIHLVDRRSVDHDRPLLGTRWTVTGWFDRQTATSTVGTPAVVVFDQGGTVTADTGCAHLTGPATIAGTTITFGPLKRVDRACTSEGDQTMDRWVGTTLRGAVSFRIAYASLTLTTVDGQGLTLSAV